MEEIRMKKEEKLNEEAALNNNLDSATLRANMEIAKEHVQAKATKTATQKKNNTNRF